MFDSCAASSSVRYHSWCVVVFYYSKSEYVLAGVGLFNDAIIERNLIYRATRIGTSQFFSLVLCQPRRLATERAQPSINTVWSGSTGAALTSID